MSILNQGIKKVFSTKTRSVGDNMIVEDLEGNRYSIPVVGEDDNQHTPGGGSARFGSRYYLVDTDQGHYLDNKGNKNAGNPKGYQLFRTDPDTYVTGSGE